MISVEKFIRDFSDEVEKHNAAIFAGAGLSVAAGFVNWSELLKDIAQELKLSIEKEHDLVSLAQYHLNESGNNRAGLNKAIIDHFLKDTNITENHEILSRLPIATFWTTNYDNLIEKAIEKSGKIADIKFKTDQLPWTKSKRDVVVYKMHGDASDANNAVIAKNDYQTYLSTRSPFVTALAGELVSKTFLFLGFSFSDPNLDHILGRIKSELKESQRTHFCILKREESKPDDSLGDFEYRKIKQEHFIKDLSYRYNIKTVLVNSYGEITEILRKIEQGHKKHTVFVSGAADDYSPWPQSEALSFCSDVSAMLIRNDFCIVNGLGLGIGSSIIEGALREIYRNQRGKLTDQLQIRPFPQTDNAKTLWTQYRQDMLDYSGVAIFLFGNKREHGNLVLSNGMKEEFEIAVSKGVLPIPLGFTGNISEELWIEVTNNFSTYFPNELASVREDLIALGDKTKSLKDHLETLEKLLKKV